MNIDLEGKKIAVLGGITPCKEIIEILTSDHLKSLDCTIAAVVDAHKKVEGISIASALGIDTTDDYTSILQRGDIDLYIKLTKDETVNQIIESIEHEDSKIFDLDGTEAMQLISDLKVLREKFSVKQQIRESKEDPDCIEAIFCDYAERLDAISDDRINTLLSEREDLIEIEKEMSQVIHGSLIPTFIINSDHIITHWNRALEELTGYMSYEVIGTDRQWLPFRSAKRPTMADVIVGQMPEEKIQKYYGNSWRKSALIKEAYEAEEFFPHMGDGGKWIYFTAAPIKSEDGTIIGAIETLRDKTEDKKAQEEIESQDQELSVLYEKYKKSEEKYRTLFNNNPNPIFILDRETLDILDVNHRVEIDYGYTKHELLGNSFLEMGDKNDTVVAEKLKGLSDFDTILFTKKKHFKKGKKSFYVNLKVCHAKYSQRDALIASATDITESVEKETQLIQAGKMATLGTMAAGMAHEINQPLNVIQICADLVQKMINKGMDIPNEELLSIANDITTNVARAAGVIKHVRDFARQSDRNLKKLNINDPINDVFKVLGHQLTVHQIEAELKLHPDLPSIRAEHNRLEQVFINLVTNAIDTMDEKAAKSEDGPVKKVLTIESGTEGKFVVVRVSDTGMGITKEIKEKIFEPFFTTKETGKGTGLGTSISFGIIKDHQGSIDIESEPGIGATFIVKFPIIE